MAAVQAGLIASFKRYQCSLAENAKADNNRSRSRLGRSDESVNVTAEDRQRICSAH
jgi:hypothetical protein